VRLLDFILPDRGCVRGLHVMANHAIRAFLSGGDIHEKKTKSKKTESAEDQAGSP